MYHVARYLAEKYDIILLSYPNHPLSHKDILRKLSAKVTLYDAIKVRDLGVYYLINTPFTASVLSRLIHEADIVIHANILPSFLVNRLAKLFGNKKVLIFDYLDHYPQSASSYYTGHLRSFLEKAVQFVVKQTATTSTGIITSSYGFAMFIGQFTRKPIYVIPNGVEPDLFRPMDIDKARREIGLDHDDLLILLYGSIDIWLDVRPLLHFIKKEKNVRLLRVGYSHGKFFDRMIDQLVKRLGIEHKVHNFPPQPYEKIPSFINASNVIVAPYNREMFKNFTTPLKVIESLSCARPVITSNIPEFRLWFEKGIFFYESYKEFYERLKKLLSTSETTYEQLLEYSEIIRRTYSWRRISQAYESVVELLCSCRDILDGELSLFDQVVSNVFRVKIPYETRDPRAY